MSHISRRLQVQLDGVLLAAIGTLVLIACAAPARPRAVIITDGARFAPATLSGRAGEQIVWHNRSQDRHSIVVGPAAAATQAGAGEPRSGDLYHNERWSHTFEQPGSYRFACAIHGDGGMVGTITIAE